MKRKRVRTLTGFGLESLFPAHYGPLNIKNISEYQSTLKNATIWTQ